MEATGSALGAYRIAMVGLGIRMGEITWELSYHEPEASFKKSRRKLLTDENLCPTLLWKDVPPSGAGAFACQPSSPLPARFLLAPHNSALHHEADFFERADVLERISLHRNHIGKVPRL